MALRRRCDVNDVRSRGFQHVRQIRKALQNTKPFPELSGHQRFQIADSNDVAAGDPTNRVYVLISNLTATDYCDTKQLMLIRFCHLSRTAQGTCPQLDSSVLEVATLVAS